MMMPLRAFAPRSSAGRLEDVFLRRYDWLRKRALALVGGDRPRADDLVHDVFVELRLGGTDAEQIRDPDAYLARMLRNLHISAIRRAARAPHRALSVVDYDSLEALVADTRHSPARPLEDAEDLRRVCLYACRRKETSKAGSALILRFFYGYTPHATAMIMRVSVGAVDRWLSLARTEARAFLREPQKLAWLDVDSPRPDADARQAHASEDLLASLRARILASRHAPCFSASELDAWDDEEAESVKRERLAHLVSCRTCLEAAASRAGLPSPWDSSSDDDEGRGSGPGWRDGANGPPRRKRRTGQDARARAFDAGLTRLQSVLEHEPQTLQIIVNGFQVGSQTVGHETVTQTVQAGVGEPIGFVEILADDCVRLLMMDVDPPPSGDIEQRLHRRLHDGRALTVSLSFAAPVPQISVTYEPSADTRVDAPPISASETMASLSPEWASTESTEGVGTRMRAWLFGERGVRRLSWRRVLAPAVAVAFAGWLLFGGGGTALAATTGRLAQTVRTWISRLFTQGEPTPRVAPIAPVAPIAAVPPTVVEAPRARPTPTRKPSTALDAAARAGIELDTLRALQSVHAYLGQEIALNTTRDGNVSVAGLVRDRERRQALLTALATVRTEHRGRLSIDIVTTDEALRRTRATAGATDSGRTASASTLRSYTVIANRFPAFDRVRAALIAESSPASSAAPSDLDARAQRFASHVLSLSWSASQHAAALHQIASRVPREVVSALKVDDGNAWLAVTRWHAGQLERDLLALGDALTRVYGQPAAQPWPPPDADGVRDADVAPAVGVAPDATMAAAPPAWALIDRLTELNTIRAYAVSRAFSVSAAGELDGGLVNTGDFWVLMKESVHAATQLRSP